MRPLRRLVVGVVIVFLVGPLFVVGVVSFNESRYMAFPPKAFSNDWYVQLVADSQWRSAMFNSFTIAASSALLAVAIALPLAYFLRTYRTRFNGGLFALGTLPFMLPPVISALGALVFWNATGHIGRIENVIIAHGVFFSTIPLITITLGMQSMDPALGEASRTLGAGPRVTFRTVTLPLLLPYLVTGYAAAFVLSLNEYIVAFMVAGFSVVTLPIKIFNSLRYGFTPTIASVSVVFTLLATTVFSLFAAFGNLPKFLGAEFSDR
ncbi:MAG: ABC transporter permease [Acidimicrobiia bacterium]|nr:ABC transporter permease [Acidimicrobiia bacterium]